MGLHTGFTDRKTTHTMNNIITTFQFSLTTGRTLNVRVTDQNGDPWFIAKDVCDVLGFANPSDATKYLDEDEKALINNPSLTANPNGNVTIINESGLYSLILRSRKAEAKRFKKWVTSEVLPSIRKHGGYLKGQEELPEGLVSSLHKTIRENALPALRYYDLLTEHNYYPGISKHKREASKQEAIIKTAVKFDLPPSFVRQLVSHGVKEALNNGSLYV
ncbi:prophage antirepressor [Desulfomicrobium baculatum DSM 4028]|uniref:Prophage antirepressor n=2 Tax=Desulfomicrobium baculatum TaxID=899 RepID=C7LPH1_DESBD|nr:prophage antirepressor [Desulfomicrobium baculatum DSM 4028]